MLETIGTGTLIGGMVALMGLAVRLLVSDKAALAKRYEDELARRDREIERLAKEREEERDRLIRSAEDWKARYFALVAERAK